jgi:rfaE bifunctional protein kinase chain/domain
MTEPSVLVVGDCMLDRYWEGSVDRISPEAPVPVLRIGSDWQRAGGAANVAVNLATLRCPVTLSTLLGQDDAGDQLAGLLHDQGVQLRAVRSAALVTTQKIRAVCRRQQLLRIDVERAPPEASVQALCDLVIDQLPAHRWVLLSDYGKGSLARCDGLIRRAASHGCKVLVDPKGRDFDRYRGAWLLKPNASEAAEVAGAWRDRADFEARMAALRAALDLTHLLVTEGEDGLTLFSADRAPLHIAAQRREVYDVSGAGDTVLATLAACLAAGQTLDDAAALANHAAGVVVGKFGTASVQPSELQAARAGLARRAA